MQQRSVRSAIAAVAGLSLVIGACGSDTSSSEPDTTAEGEVGSATPGTPGETAAAEALPTIVVTTNILGDVVSEVVGDAANVVTVMPVGADPHDFQASAQEVDVMMNADALIVNGGGLEEGLLDAIESVEDAGVPTFEALSAVAETIEFGEGGHDHSDEDHEHEGDDHDHEGEEKDEDHDHEGEDHDHEGEESPEGIRMVPASSDDEDHDHEGDDHDHEGEEKDEDHSDEDHSDHDHDHSGVDPHFWLDPMAMAEVVDGMVEFLEGEVTFADPEAIAASAAAYVDELEAIDAESVTMFATIPEETKVLVTNHDNLGYFAAHYGFEVAGTVIPNGTTTDSASAGEIAELAELIQEEQVPAIFADNTASDELAQTLAAEVGSDVEVIEIYTGSLGEPGSDGETYLLMLSTNAERITAGLA